MRAITLVGAGYDLEEFTKKFGFDWLSRALCLGTPVYQISVDVNEFNFDVYHVYRPSDRKAITVATWIPNDDQENDMKEIIVAEGHLLEADMTEKVESALGHC